MIERKGERSELKEEGRRKIRRGGVMKERDEERRQKGDREMSEKVG